MTTSDQSQKWLQIANRNKDKLILVATILILSIIGLIAGLVATITLYEDCESKLKLGTDSENSFEQTIPSNWKKAAQGTYKTAAVATDVPYCSQLASDLMENQNANAVDASVVSVLCIGVLSPGASGVGGGGISLVRQPQSGTIQVYDCRETAPAAANETMYVNRLPTASMYGALAIAVPGEFHCLYDMWKDHGSLPWRDLVEPVALLAQNFSVDAYLAKTLRSANPLLWLNPTMKQVFYNSEENRPKIQGEFCQWTSLAATFQQIAEQGIGVLYDGPLGESLVKDIQKAGGIVTMDDLRHYRTVMRQPLSTFYQGYQVYSAGNPFGGPVMQQALNIFEYYNLPKLKGFNKNSAHWMVEGWKFGYADRFSLGDPAFVENATFYVETMLSKSHAAQLRSRLSPNTTFPPEHYQDLWPLSSSPEDHGTSHVSIVDKQRLAVAMTTTINLGFGSLFASNSTGILLNDEMDDFSSPNRTNAFGYPPSPNNFIRPGKRPLSSMVPSIVTANNQLFLVVGGSGGSRIITATCQVLLNILAYGMDAGTAVGAPRLHDQLLPDVLKIEDEYPQDVAKSLEQMGYVLAQTDSLANVQAIIVNDNQTLNAASDWRKIGAPYGYTKMGKQKWGNDFFPRPFGF